MLTSVLTASPADHYSLMMWMPGPWEMVIILIVGLLIFGKRLPEIARNMGKGVVEFKKGIRGIEDEVSDAGSSYQPPAKPIQDATAEPRDAETK